MIVENTAKGVNLFRGPSVCLRRPLHSGTDRAICACRIYSAKDHGKVAIYLVGSQCNAYHTLLFKRGETGMGTQRSLLHMAINRCTRAFLLLSCSYEGNGRSGIETVKMVSDDARERMIGRNLEAVDYIRPARILSIRLRRSTLNVRISRRRWRLALSNSFQACWRSTLKAAERLASW